MSTDVLFGALTFVLGGVVGAAIRVYVNDVARTVRLRRVMLIACGETIERVGRLDAKFEDSGKVLRELLPSRPSIMLTALGDVYSGFALSRPISAVQSLVEGIDLKVMRHIWKFADLNERAAYVNAMYVQAFRELFGIVAAAADSDEDAVASASYNARVKEYLGQLSGALGELQRLCKELLTVAIEYIEIFEREGWDGGENGWSIIEKAKKVKGNSR